MMCFTSLPRLFGLQYIVLFFNIAEQFSDFNQQLCRLENINHWVVVFAIKVEQNCHFIANDCDLDVLVAIQFENSKLMQI